MLRLRGPKLGFRGHLELGLGSPRAWSRLSGAQAWSLGARAWFRGPELGFEWPQA